MSCAPAQCSRHPLCLTAEGTGQGTGLRFSRLPAVPGYPPARCPTQKQQVQTHQWKSKPASYGQILRSSAILGGAQGLVYLMLIARTKVVAILLGPSGIGTLSIYQSITAFVSTISSLGIPTSGVREIADADRANDPERLSRAVRILKRVSWLTGLLGWLLTATFAYPLCHFTFESSEHAWAVVILGASLVFSAVAGGQLAILQGRRRIGDLARLQVVSTGLSALLSIALYAWLGQAGIVPSLILGAAIQWGVAWWFSHRIVHSPVIVSWTDTLRGSRQMVLLGVAFMWNAVITGAVALATRALIVSNLGLEAGGIYQAAWALSGLFAGFILAAMGTDFFPRLTAVADDPAEINRLVNEQTEIGVLLAMPGLLFTLALAPWLMEIFYTRQFVVGSDLLPWFVLGIFGQIASWPLGYIQMAKGASRAFIVTQTLFNGLHMGLVIGFFHHYGLIGVSLALPTLYAIYTGSMLVYCRYLTGFRWSSEVNRLVLVSALGVGIAFAVAAVASNLWASGVELALGLVASVLTIRGLAVRLPPSHRLRQALERIQARLPRFG